MKIYNYHPHTGVFVGEGVADPSPLEENVWLVPAHATEIAPPPFGADSQAVFENGGWRIESIQSEEIQKPDPKAVAAGEARGYLYSTDWYVIRKMETGEEIPQEVSEKRAAARIVLSE